jgi:hypothetical protein
MQLLQTTTECIEQSAKKCDKLGIDINQIKGIMMRDCRHRLKTLYWTFLLVFAALHATLIAED